MSAAVCSSHVPFCWTDLVNIISLLAPGHCSELVLLVMADVSGTGVHCAALQAAYGRLRYGQIYHQVGAALVAQY
jgi:hypothetical protein